LAQNLIAEVHAQVEQLGPELAEIDLLLQQTRTEAERHEERRGQLAERLAALERDPLAAGQSLPEVRSQLLVLTRRTAQMEGQIQVLEGKQKTLLRFRDFLEQLIPKLPAPEGAAGSSAGSPAQSRVLLAAQEEMRRDIARQMHDGPAQSIANIALQAQILQRLIERDPAQAQAELDRLGSMVQHALDETKRFIFAVRPMVLDDLGLVPTLRRATLDSSRRSSVPIKFESVGQDRRLGEELESSLFRILQDALAAFIATQPLEVAIRLDWTEEEVRAVIRSLAEPGGVPESAMQPPSLDDPDLPPMLAGVMRDKEEYEAAKSAERVRARALPVDLWNELRARAAAVGIEVALREDGRRLEATVNTGATPATPSAS